MALRTAIYSCLKADSGVTALLGSGDALRYYPQRVPQSTDVPFVASAEILGRAAVTHGVPDDAEDCMDESTVQFSCYAPVYEDALAIRAAVRTALLDDTSGVLAAAHIVVTAPQTREVYEDAVDLHCAQLDLTFFHNPNT